MNQTRRWLILGIAVTAAIGAAVIASTFYKPAAPITVQPTGVESIQVLVAKRDIRLGDRVSANDLRWQAWPKEAAANGYILKTRRPNAIADFDKSIARMPALSGEPISEGKFIRCTDEPGKKAQCEGGAMAAILPAGMRAISAKITEDSAAGRFILPNDMVDVILTRRMRARGAGNEEAVSDTLFQNVRILAIGQNIETKDGKKVVEGNTATLELTPEQAEQLALAKTLGELSLSLRSLADLRNNGAGPIGKDKLSSKRGGGIKVLRYGVASRAFGVN
jgi:pilus assembly protein CpaB